MPVKSNHRRAVSVIRSAEIAFGTYTQLYLELGALHVQTENKVGSDIRIFHTDKIR